MSGEATPGDLKSKLAAIVPDKLDAIIKINRDQLTLEYVDICQTQELSMELQTTNIKHELSEAFLYKRKITIPTAEGEHICLVGFAHDGERELAWHTSAVVGVDTQNMVIKTKSGSYYRVKNFVEGEGHVNLLIHICAVAHQDGWGEHFGISPFFY